MNYKMHYDELIIKHELSDLTQYGEVHHIVPRCMGGGDEKENLVRLSPEAHFVAHQLLAKMYPDNYKLINAASIMCISKHHKRNNNKLYSWIRKKIAIMQSHRSYNYWNTPGNRESFSEIMKIAMNKPEVKQKVSDSLKIAMNKPEVKEKIKISRKITDAKPEVKQRRSEATKKYANLPESRKRNSELQKIAQNRPDVKEKKSIAQSKANAKQEVKDKHIAINARPEVKESKQKSITELWRLRKIYVTDTGFSLHPSKITREMIASHFNFDETWLNTTISKTLLET